MIDFDAKEREINERFNQLKDQVVADETKVKENTEELVRIQGEFRLLAELRKLQETNE